MTSAERRPTGTPAHGSPHPRLPRTGAGARAWRCAAVAPGLPHSAQAVATHAPVAQVQRVAHAEFDRLPFPEH